MKNYAKVIVGLAIVSLLGLGPLYAATMHTFGTSVQSDGGEFQWSYDQGSGNLLAGGVVNFWFTGAVVGAPGWAYSFGNEALFAFEAYIEDPETGLYAGDFSILEGSDGSGVNMVSGTFEHVTFNGSGFNASSLGASVDLSSYYIIFPLGAGEEASWGFNWADAFDPEVSNNASGGVGTFATTQEHLTVPEPGTLSLIGLGLVCVAIVVRRRA